MRIPWVPLLALTAAAPSASALEVVHQPATCSTADSYLRVAARGVPADAVASGEVRFRVDARGAWYAVRMRSVEGEWAATLPRPQPQLTRFEYQVALTGADAQSTTSGPITVEVRGDCPLPGSAVADTIVVQVPPGAPLVPPVPLGFSPVGASTPQEERRQAPRPTRSGLGTRLALGVGLAGVAGGATALAAGERAAITPSPDDPSQQLPSFTFTGTIPPAGTTLSLGRDSFGVIVTMDREPAEPLPLQFTVGLQTAVNTSRCANVTGTFQGAQRPLGLVLTGPIVLAPGAPCGEAFDVGALVLSVRAKDRLVMQGTVPLGKALRVEP